MIFHTKRSCFTNNMFYKFVNRLLKNKLFEQKKIIIKKCFESKLLYESKKEAMKDIMEYFLLIMKDDHYLQL